MHTHLSHLSDRGALEQGSLLLRSFCLEAPAVRNRLLHSCMGCTVVHYVLLMSTPSFQIQCTALPFSLHDAKDPEQSCDLVCHPLLTEQTHVTHRHEGQRREAGSRHARASSRRACTEVLRP